MATTAGINHNCPVVDLAAPPAGCYWQAVPSNIAGGCPSHRLTCPNSIGGGEGSTPATTGTGIVADVTAFWNAHQVLILVLLLAYFFGGKVKKWV